MRQITYKYYMKIPHVKPLNSNILYKFTIYQINIYIIYFKEIFFYKKLKRKKCIFWHISSFFIKYITLPIYILEIYIPYNSIHYSFYSIYVVIKFLFTNFLYLLISVGSVSTAFAKDVQAPNETVKYSIND